MSLLGIDVSHYQGEVDWFAVARGNAQSQWWRKGRSHLDESELWLLTGDNLPTLIGRYFEDHVGRRLYIQVDKPLYKPGETIWFKTWDLQARTLSGSNAAQASTVGDVVHLWCRYRLHVPVPH